jgi:hypothetical protein
MEIITILFTVLAFFVGKSRELGVNASRKIPSDVSEKSMERFSEQIISGVERDNQ